MASSVTEDLTLHSAVERFLQTEFIIAVGEVRAHIIAPEIAVQNLLKTPFVQATILLHEKWIGLQSLSIQNFFETPLIKALWILREKSALDAGSISTIQDAADAFLHTDFLACIDYLRDHTAAPERAVQRLLRTPFVRAVEFLHENWKETRDVAIEKLFETPLFKEIMILRQTVITGLKSIESKGNIKDEVDKFLHTKFILAVDYLRSNCSGPEHAVQMLMETPFIKAMEMLNIEKENMSGQSKVVVERVFQTQVMRAIHNLRQKS